PPSSIAMGPIPNNLQVAPAGGKVQPSSPGPPPGDPVAPPRGTRVAPRDVRRKGTNGHARCKASGLEPRWSKRSNGRAAIMRKLWFGPAILAPGLATLLALGAAGGGEDDRRGSRREDFRVTVTKLLDDGDILVGQLEIEARPGCYVEVVSDKPDR